MKLKKLVDCGNGFDANQLQGRLMKSGIRSMLKNEVKSYFPMISTCALFVSPGDFMSAQRILDMAG